ncbi:MAG: sigma-70 family RNA polymerase sigma factor [Dehalococcoidia bacterium]
MDKPRDLPAGSERESAGSPNDHIRQEWAVVQRAQALNEEALATIYATYYPRIYNYAYLHIGEVHTAEDLASDVMLKVLESIQKYQFKGAPFSAWVFRIARNRLVDLHRRRKRRGEVNLTEPLAALQISPQALAERALDRGQLQLALKYLTEEQRQVIVLKFIQGFDNASIARILKRSEGAIKSLQHRALNSLRRIMSGEDR